MFKNSLCGTAFAQEATIPAYLVVTVYSIVIAVQAPWPIIGAMLYKHPIHAFAAVMGESNTGAQNVCSNLHDPH